MVNHARITLENALRARKLDHTLTLAPALGDLAGQPPPNAAAALLESGFPPGQVSEITGPPSSGRLTMVLQAMARATSRGELVAFIDTFDRLDVASTAAAGVAFDRLLWVRGQPAISPRLSGPPSPGRSEALPDSGDRTVDRALKAFMLVLQAGGFGLVVLDLADVPMVVLRRLPAPTWLRMQRAVEGRDTAVVLLAPEPLTRSAGGLTMQVRARLTWHGAERSRFLTGVALDARVTSPRRLFDGHLTITADAAELVVPISENCSPAHQLQSGWHGPVAGRHAG